MPGDSLPPKVPPPDGFTVGATVGMALDGGLTPPEVAAAERLKGDAVIAVA